MTDAELIAAVKRLGFRDVTKADGRLAARGLDRRNADGNAEALAWAERQAARLGFYLP